MVHEIINIPEGFHHYATTVFADTQEAYDAIELPEKFARHLDDPELENHPWKELSTPAGGRIYLHPPA